MKTNAELIKVLQGAKMDAPKLFDVFSGDSLIHYFEAINEPNCIQPYVPMAKHLEIMDLMGVRIPDGTEVYYNMPRFGDLTGQTLSDTEQITFRYDRISHYWEYVNEQRIVPHYLLILRGLEKYMMNPNIDLESIVENLKVGTIEYEWYHFGTSFEMRDPQDKHNIWNRLEVYPIGAYLTTHPITQTAVQCTYTKRYRQYLEGDDELSAIPCWRDVSLYPTKPFFCEKAYREYVSANVGLKEAVYGECMLLIPIHNTTPDIIKYILKYEL